MEQHIRALSRRIPLLQEILYLMVHRLATRFISPKFLRDTKQGIRGKNKHIGLSLSKRNQQEICLIFSKNMLHASDRKEQHMNLIEKALRYIYILTSKAGLEYDLQSREVWRGKRSGRKNGKSPIRLFCWWNHLRNAERNKIFYKNQRSRSKNNTARCGDLFYLDSGSANAYRRNDCRRRFPRLSRRRLTSKEVAA